MPTEKFDGRIIVLRGVDENEKKIWFHSDIRSNKIKILEVQNILHKRC